MDTNEHCVWLKILKGKNLPKADKAGTIDAYVKVSFPKATNGKVKEQILKTSVIKNTYKPVWKETLTCNNVVGNSIQIQVYDWDTLSDDYVGAATIPNTAGKYTIPLELGKGMVSSSEKGKPSTITCEILKFPSMKVLAARIGNSALIDKEKNILAVPFGPSAYICLVYGSTLGVYIVETSKTDNYFSFFGTSPFFKVRRETATAAGEAKFNFCKKKGLQWTSVDFSSFKKLLKISAYHQSCTLRWKKVMNLVVREHGWSGRMEYEEAKEKLTDVVCDDKSKKIYFSVAGYGCLEIDYDKKDGDIGWYLYEQPTADGCLPDIVHQKYQSRLVKVYKKPKEVGPDRCSTAAVIDDIPRPVQLPDIELYVHQLTGERTAKNIGELFGLTKESFA